MITALIVVFAVGYLLIALEHILQINKATFALLMCGVLWSIYALFSGDPTIHESLIEKLGDTSEIIFFLIGAMTIVELIDKYDGFSFITKHIKASNKKKLMWILAFVTFFMSATLDNMTTTIIMVMMLRRLLSSKSERWIFAGVIIIAANSGGAWSPIGDVTTIMLWMKNNVTSVNLIQYLLVPCIVSVVVPVTIASLFMVKNSATEQLSPQNVGRQGILLSKVHPKVSKFILVMGVLSLLFVPFFKTLTGLPPYIGIMVSLSGMWILTEFIVRYYRLDGQMEGRVSQAVRHIDMSTILFFLGILMAVGALQQASLLQNAAHMLDEEIHEPYTISGLIGVFSSIVDNVPLVSACMSMYPVVTDVAATSDPEYMQFFVQDGLFWHLLTFCAGVGGSLLIIGSAAGVVAMGIEKIPFLWYVKKFTLLAFSGYIAGILCIWLEEYFSLLT